MSNLVKGKGKPQKKRGKTSRSCLGDAANETLLGLVPAAASLPEREKVPELPQRAAAAARSLQGRKGAARRRRLADAARPVAAGREFN